MFVCVHMCMRLAVRVTGCKSDRKIVVVQIKDNGCLAGEESFGAMCQSPLKCSRGQTRPPLLISPLFFKTFNESIDESCV